MVTIKRLLNKSFKKRTLSDVSPHIRYGHLSEIGLRVLQPPHHNSM